jgi:phosphoserine phosphatase
MRFIIARHGKTDENQRGLLSGISDTASIAGPGVLQALYLVQYLGRKRKFDFFDGTQIDFIVSSTSRRAWQTVNPLAKDLGIFINKFPELREMDFGEFDGKAESLAHEHMEKRRHDLGYCFPGGECYNNLINRVEKIINPIWARNRGVCLVVTHGGPVRIIRALLLGLDFHKTPELMTTLECKNSIVYDIDTKNKSCRWIDICPDEYGTGLI